jgi:glycosyltransferase involved in cell wall biosynthesis
MTSYLNILGIRGIPANHGGFESFVARFAPFMSEQGWKVTVYCQADEGVRSPRMWIDDWNGIRRVHFETRTRGSLATIEFDLKTVLHVLRQPGIDLVLGYNTAVFNILQRLFGRRLIMNMDGIEWKRQKWGKAAKTWFWINEWIGARIASVPIADHPMIAEHLAKRGVRNAVIIPYGSDLIADAPVAPLSRFGIVPNDYFISIARVEPENSILEMVEAFVKARTGRKFMVLGKLDPHSNPYHARVMQAADESVIFPGAIYDAEIVRALRFHCRAYMHGHQVGGTNPSLVEALGAGNAVIARNNPFNCWTAGDEQLFFSSVEECTEAIRRLSQHDIIVRKKGDASHERHKYNFQYDSVHRMYLDVICRKKSPATSSDETARNEALLKGNPVPEQRT